MEQHADEMIVGRWCGHLVSSPIDETAGTDICQSCVEALGLEQCLQQQRHALAVAIALAQHLGGLVGGESGRAGFVCHIAYVLLHPGQGTGDACLVSLAAVGNGGNERIALWQRAVNLFLGVSPAIQVGSILEGSDDKQRRTQSLGTGHQRLLLQAGLVGDGIDNGLAAPFVGSTSTADVWRHLPLHDAVAFGKRHRHRLMAHEVSVVQRDARQQFRVVKRPLKAGCHRLPLVRYIEIEIADLGVVEEDVLGGGTLVLSRGEAGGRGTVNIDGAAIEDERLNPASLPFRRVGGSLTVLHLHLPLVVVLENIVVTALADDDEVVVGLSSDHKRERAERNCQENG